jgi:hypothetical protein
MAGHISTPDFALMCGSQGIRSTKVASELEHRRNEVAVTELFQSDGLPDEVAMKYFSGSTRKPPD